MGKPAGAELCTQRIRNMLLPDYVCEAERAPFTVKSLIHELPISLPEIKMKKWADSSPAHQSNVVFCYAVPCKTAHQKIETNIRTAFLPSPFKIGKPVAHAGFCLMLLGSPPDMVHSPTLHSTNLSSPAC